MFMLLLLACLNYSILTRAVVGLSCKYLLCSEASVYNPPLNENFFYLDFMNNFGVSIRLKAARIAAGYKSAKDFCERFAIPASTYSLHETGGRGLKKETAQRYAVFLDIDLEWLLHGTSRPYCAPIKNNSSPLSQDEFLSLLKYSGNPRVQRDDQAPGLLDQVQPLLLGKIFIALHTEIQALKIDMDDIQLTQSATTIYQNIMNTSTLLEEQLSMIDLSVALFRKQLKEQIETQLLEVMAK